MGCSGWFFRLTPTPTTTITSIWKPCRGPSGASNDASTVGWGPGGTVILIYLLIIFALVLSNAFFSGAEIAVLSLPKTRVEELEGHDKRGWAIRLLRDEPERFLATVQIGMTGVGIVAAVFAGSTVAPRLADWLRDSGLGWHAGQIALILVIALLMTLSLVAGELVPKSLALRYAERFALAVARPLLFLSWLMRPLVWFFTASSNLVLGLFGDSTTFMEARLSPDELQHLVEEAAKTGSLDPRAGEIASRAFDFGSLHVAEVMIPKSQIIALRRHASVEEVQRVILEQGHSRMPVYEGSIGNIVGYVIAKDVLALTWQRQLLVLEDIIRPATFVAESMRAVDALGELKRRRTGMAIVMDEQGGLAGLVTMEDLVEELVGEIFSEHDVAVELVRREADGTAIAQGSAQIRDVNRELGLELPEGEGYSTIAGLCITLAGWIPQPGARLITTGGTVLEVIEASPRRVRTVRIHVAPPPSAT